MRSDFPVLKKAKSECDNRALAVKGTVAGRPPATPQTKGAVGIPNSSAGAFPPQQQAGLAKPLVLQPPPPPPKAPAYVHCPVPSVGGVKVEMKPTQNAASILRQQKARPTTKTEPAPDQASGSLVAAVSKAPPVPPSTIAQPELERAPPVAPAPADGMAIATSHTPLNTASATPPQAETITPTAATTSTATPPNATSPTPSSRTAETTDTQRAEIERENKIRDWVAKFDDVEIKSRIEKCKKHALFPEYEMWRRTNIFDVEPDEAIPEFGEDDDQEELVSFLFWLEDHTPVPENALPDPNPAETATLAVAATRSQEPRPKHVTFQDRVTVHPAPSCEASPPLPNTRATPAVAKAEARPVVPVPAALPKATVPEPAAATPTTPTTPATPAPPPKSTPPTPAATPSATTPVPALANQIHVAAPATQLW